MKNLFNLCVFVAGFCMMAILYACKKDGALNPVNKVSTGSTVRALSAFNFEQTNLVADTDGFNAAHIDPNLVNAWGIAIGPTGGVWISSNHQGSSPIYNVTGVTLRPPVIVPAAAPGETGSPTGMVFNDNPKCFIIPSTGLPGRFIMCSEDGVITAWSGGNAAVIVADHSAWGAVYKGLTIGMDHGSEFLFAANFKGGTIDVFDNAFHYNTGRKFKDPGIPSDYGPFNIRYIDNKLYVTYAKHLPPDNEDDQSGPGNGYVDIFNTDGTLFKRLITQGMLNSPWGITKAGAGFADSDEVLLIGNFGDGKINVYDLNGNFKGQLQNNGNSIVIPGLWAIDFLKNNARDGLATDPLYFTAGPDDESHGLFGYLKKM